MDRQTRAQQHLYNFIHHRNSSKEQQRMIIFCVVLLTSVFIIMMPFAKQEIREFLFFVPIYSIAVILFELITMYLLFSEFVVSRSLSLVVLAAGYLFVGLLNLFYMLTFPGIFSSEGLLHASSQTASWFLIFSQMGFALYVIVYTQINKRFNNQLTVKQVSYFLIVSIVVTMIFVTIIMVIAIFGVDHFAEVMNGRNYTHTLYGFGFVILFLNCSALIMLLSSKSQRNVIDLCLMLTVLAAMFGAIFGLYADSRFSVGWYTSRIITTLSAGFVLFTLLVEIRRLYHTVAEQENIFRAVFESSVIGIIRTDLERNILEANEVFYKMTGYGSDEIKNLVFVPGMPEKNWAINQSIYDELFRGERNNYQLYKYYKRKDGSTMWVSIIISLVRKMNNSPETILFMIEDITERKMQEEKIYFQAYHDSLTGLLKRNAFMTQLNLAIEDARKHSTKFGVMFFDLDEFKSVNDTFGHGVGDLLLKSVAERFLTVAREGDVFARLGGDEFIAFFPNIYDVEDMKKMAKQILELFRHSFEIEGNELLVTISIGMSMYPNHGHTEKELIKCADTAMYVAKEHGKNRYALFTPSE